MPDTTHSELEAVVRRLVRMVALNSIEIEALQNALPGAESARLKQIRQTLLETKGPFLRTIEQGDLGALSQILEKALQK